LNPTDRSAGFADWKVMNRVDPQTNPPELLQTQQPSQDWDALLSFQRTSDGQRGGPNRRPMRKREDHTKSGRGRKGNAAFFLTAGIVRSNLM